MAWTYEEDPGGPVAALDPVFRNGNAPRFHGMLRKLAETEGPGIDNIPPDPVYVDVWKMDPFSQNDGEVRAGQQIGADWEFSNCYSILAGSARADPKPELGVEQFFHHADVLSGQDVGKVDGEPAYEVRIRSQLNITTGGWVAWALDRIETARACKPGASIGPGTSDYLWNDLCDYFDTNSRLWTESWNTQAGLDAREKFRQLRIWYHDPDMVRQFRCWGLGRLAQCLAGFAALIHGARLDLDNLMGACVEQVHAWNDEGQLPYTESDALAWKALTGVVGVATAGSAIAVPIAATELLDTLTKAMGMHKTLEPGGCYEILANYLTEADGILKSAAAGVTNLVEEMNHIRSGFPAVPKWE